MIFDKVLQIYQKYYICIHCLGRMFSLLGSYTTNYERGNSLLLSLTMENHWSFLSLNNERQEESIANLKILAEKAQYLPAQKVLQNEGLTISEESEQSCYLCHGIFSNVKKYVETAKSNLKNIEYNNFLVGTSLEAQITNQEDDFKAKFKILEAESFKSHFNREIGKHLAETLEKPPEFKNPDILIIFFLDFESFSIELNPKSLFIFGTYNKFIRSIPQTHWFCRNCMGKGCKLCDYSGKQYLESVEEMVSPEFLKESLADGSKFHGAGREDIDVKMLGRGRPFILELKNPKVRKLNLTKIEKRVNKSNKKKVSIHNLRYSDKKEVIKLKAEAERTKKIYKAKVVTSNRITRETFKEKIVELKKIFENQEIHQRTPNRVSHRRADKIRDKLVFKIEGIFVNPQLFEFVIETQGGTYIKELINGDEGRTSPSFSEVFQVPLVCKELDVIDISY
ncbi:MAG: tRNA pseudouridine(54/55) synthase Pus10 [Promethearchaeota archaeon]